MRTLVIVALILAAAGVVTGITAIVAQPAGPEGPQGLQGPQGPQGVVGAVGPQGPAGDVSCQECHDETTLIVAKRTAWETSLHGSGTAYLRGTNASCAGCHSSEGFTVRVETGVDFESLEAGIPEPSRQNCRTCHNIHTDYTKDDFELSTTDAVAMLASGAIFDGGEGNLCASCHQPRRAFPAAEGGLIDVNSTHWGPHHGVEAATLLGVGGYGDPGEPTPGHYAEEDGVKAEDTCVTCHLGPNQVHTFAPNVASCQIEGCHEAEKDGVKFSFNYENVQEDVQALIDELGEKLEALGLLHDGHPVVGKYPEVQAGALWNYIFVASEDGSLGVHNSEYIKRLLEDSIASLQ